jgi:hypothetical protein
MSVAEKERPMTTPITLDREAVPGLPQRMMFDGLNCYPLNTFPDWAVKKEGWQYVTVTAEPALASTGEGESLETDLAEKKMMTWPSLANFARRLERERDEARAKLVESVNRMHEAQAQMTSLLLENEALRALRSIPAAGTNTGEAILAPLREFRDTILHERGALEGEWFGADRVNAVLSEFDDAMQAVEAVIATPPKESAT